MSTTMTDEDREILSLADQALADGIEMYTWWDKTSAKNNFQGFDDPFPLFYNSTDTGQSIGFLDEIPVEIGRASCRERVYVLV